MPDHLSALGVPIAVVTMYVAQRIERRLGAAAAGWFAALPIAFGVAAATIAVTVGRSDASLVAMSAVGHAGPMVAYAVAFVLLTTRLGALRGFVLAALVYGLASVAVVPISEPVRIGIGVVCIALGTAFMARRPGATRLGQEATTTQQILSLASAGVVVAVITMANHYSGPELAGAVGAFPTMTTTIALFVAYRAGARNAGPVMGGMVRSLPIYVVYCLAFAFLITRTSALVAVVGAGCLALGTAMLTWRKVERVDLRMHRLLVAEP